MSTPHGCLTTHHGNTRTLFCISVWESYGGVLYLECVTGIWVNFKEITKGKWSRHQALGFFYGVGHFILFDFITDPRLRKMSFFLI